MFDIWYRRRKKTFHLLNSNREKKMKRENKIVFFALPRKRIMAISDEHHYRAVMWLKVKWRDYWDNYGARVGYAWTETSSKTIIRFKCKLLNVERVNANKTVYSINWIETKRLWCRMMNLWENKVFLMTGNNSRFPWIVVLNRSKLFLVLVCFFF